MNNKEFIATLAVRTGMKMSETQRLMDSVIGALEERFSEGDAVQLTNFGVFEVKKKLERVMVNPSTGQRMLVPPKLTLAFKPFPAWREKIKKGGND